MGQFMTLKNVSIKGGSFNIILNDEIRNIIYSLQNDNQKLFLNFLHEKNIDLNSNEKQTIYQSGCKGHRECSDIHPFFKIDSYNHFCSPEGRDRIWTLAQMMKSGEIKITVLGEYSLSNKLTYIIKKGEIFTKDKNVIRKEDYFNSYLKISD